MESGGRGKQDIPKGRRAPLSVRVLTPETLDWPSGPGGGWGSARAMRADQQTDKAKARVQDLETEYLDNILSANVNTQNLKQE